MVYESRTRKMCDYILVEDFGYHGVVVNIVSIVGMVVGIVANNVGRVPFSGLSLKLTKLNLVGWSIYRGNAAEISVAKCYFKIQPLKASNQCLVNMTKL